MHIKRFEAPTMEAALAQVRATLGPDALILSSRTLRNGRGAFGLLTRPVVEVQAAIERAEDRMPAPGEEATLREPTGLPMESPEQRRFEREVREELRALRLAIGRLETPAEARTPLGTAALTPPQHRLVAGLDPTTAERTVTGWRQACAETPGLTLDDFLSSRLQDRIVPPRAPDRRRLRVLVGAAGAGKTTSLAKLAARNEEGEREVTLVSLDGERVGASASLRRYAELLASPFYSMDRADGLARLLDREGEVLVDTAGRDRGRSDAGLRSLRERVGPRMEIDLVLDATARPDVQRSQLARFAPLSPDRVIFTRCDELDGLGPVASLLMEDACPPVCWLGTGQRVPDDFRVAEPDAMLRELTRSAA